MATYAQKSTVDKRAVSNMAATAPVSLEEARAKAAPRLRLCVTMPALNEEATVAQLIKRIPRNIPGISNVFVIMVDDGSTDQTADLAEKEGAIIVAHAKTRGVGMAFQAGVQKSLELGADLMVNMDADGQFNPEDIPTLIAPLVDGRAGFVTASRFISKECVPDMNPVKYWGNLGMSWLISTLAGHRFYDVSCGFRAFTRDTLQQLNLFGHFTYTQETFLDLSYKQVDILEIPIKIRGKRKHGKSRVAPNVLRYAAKSGTIIFRSFRDYKPLHFFGVPAALMVGTSIGLGVFLMNHWLDTGAFSPHKWAGFAAAALFGGGVFLLIVGLIGDMMARIRLNQERILYLLKKNDYRQRKANGSHHHSP